MEQCGQAGITGIIIISAGFKETGPEGKALEERILEIKKKYDMHIIGPNCLGIIHPDINLNTTFIPGMQAISPLSPRAVRWVQQYLT